MSKAREQHYLSYPTYTNDNIIDESMKALFPFWNYEIFRWRWLPRTFMRTPGTLTGLARWMDYTDGGYIPVPFTDLQINIFRGSTWMGGLLSLYRKDFPEYYDFAPGTQWLDTIQRYGFFPNILVSGSAAVFGQATNKPEWAELAPAWVSSTLSGLRQLSPEHIGKGLNVIYPDRFRDFQTMLTLGAMGEDADLIWRKKKLGQALTPEEEKLWLRAGAKANGIKNVLMEQIGMLRIRPKEYDEVKREMRLAIQDATGVPVKVQVQIDRMSAVTGKRFSDIYKLDIRQQKLLYSFESFRRWRGVTEPLLPASQQLLDIRIAEYYESIDELHKQARYEGFYEGEGTNRKLLVPSIAELNRQWVSKEIGPDQWLSGRERIVSQLQASVRDLGNTPAYKDVPKTLSEREEWLKTKGIITTAYSPDQELLQYYYDMKPDYSYNWDSGRNELDFETYFAKVDILLDSLDATHRDLFLQRIQSEWTPLERLYWQTSREYLRPYRQVREGNLARYTPDQQRLIRRFEVARGTERDDIMATLIPTGEKLISNFQSTLTDARQNMRTLDPELDAWLYFWGKTDKLLTLKAQELSQELERTYRAQSMVR